MNFKAHLDAGLRRVSAAGVFLFSCCLFLAILVFGHFTIDERSYQITAKTRGVELTFVGSNSAWALPDVSACIRGKNAGTQKIKSPTVQLCDPNYFKQIDAKSVELAWHRGTILNVTGDPKSGNIIVQIADLKPEDNLSISGTKLTNGSLLHISQGSFLKAGALVFSGHVKVGSVPSPGADDFLTSGKYKIFETLPLTANPTMVKQGNLEAGERIAVELRADQTPVAVNGFLSASMPDSGPIGIVVNSASEDAWLRIDRLGSQPSYQVPHWTDRVIQDPVLIGISTLLALVLIVVELFKAFQRKNA